MNYQHAFHAGNFADVVKHVALVGILSHLRKKETGFAVIDSHAGRGLYDLGGEQARRTGEAAAGITRLSGLVPPLGPLADYLRIVGESGQGYYPGSPLIAARLLRPQDRLVALERNPEEAAKLSEVLAPFRKTAVETVDGYPRLLKLLPPQERRGLVLIDPPFEATDEFEQLAAAVRAAYRRFTTGIFLLWYPIKSQSAVDSFVGEVLATGAAQALTIEIAVMAEASKLARAGLMVLNPPFGFDPAMRIALAALAPLLEAKIDLVWRVGGA